MSAFGISESQHMREYQYDPEKHDASLYGAFKTKFPVTGSTDKAAVSIVSVSSKMVSTR